MKVLIVGAGMQGHVITWNLARNPAVSQIVLGDYDEGRARLVAEKVGGGKSTPHLPGRESTPPPSPRRRREPKLVVNAVIPEYNMSIMRACLRPAPPIGTWRPDRPGPRLSTKPIWSRRPWRGILREAGFSRS